MSRNVWAEEAIFSVSFISTSFGNINGIQLAKFGLLIDRTLPIFLKVRLKVLATVIMLPFCLEGVKEKMDKEAAQFLLMLIPINAEKCPPISTNMM